MQAQQVLDEETLWMEFFHSLIPLRDGSPNHNAIAGLRNELLHRRVTALMHAQMQYLVGYPSVQQLNLVLHNVPFTNELTDRVESYQEFIVRLKNHLQHTAPVRFETLLAGTNTFLKLMRKYALHMTATPIATPSEDRSEGISPEAPSQRASLSPDMHPAAAPPSAEGNYPSPDPGRQPTTAELPPPEQQRPPVYEFYLPAYVAFPAGQIPHYNTSELFIQCIHIQMVFLDSASEPDDAGLKTPPSQEAHYRIARREFVAETLKLNFMEVTPLSFFSLVRGTELERTKLYAELMPVVHQLMDHYMCSPIWFQALPSAIAAVILHRSLDLKLQRQVDPSQVAPSLHSIFAEIVA